MSLKNISVFLNSELDDVNKKIRNIDLLVKDNNLRIDEANYFINDIKGKSSDLSSSYVSEKNKNEKLTFEKNALDKCMQLKKNYDAELETLLLKKENLESCIKSLNSSVESKVSVSREKNNLSKKEVADIVDEIQNANEFISKSINKFSYHDPNRVITDYKIFNDRLNDIIDKIEQLAK